MTTNEQEQAQPESGGDIEVKPKAHVDGNPEPYKTDGNPEPYKTDGNPEPYDTPN
jgi:hypothetical protein